MLMLMVNWRPSRQLIVVAGLLLAVGVTGWRHLDASQCRAIEAGFWFEDVAYDSVRLGGPITRDELAAIVTMARAEVANAFAGLDVTVTDRRTARHRVRVVQELRDMRFRRTASVPAESRAVSGFGGQGAVSFSWLASGAVVYAPEDASRAAILEGIAKGIGRAAVHEFAHIILPKAPIHDSEDVFSYEYRSAARREQFYGDLHWERAWPLLQARFARCGHQQAS